MLLLRLLPLLLTFPIGQLRQDDVLVAVQGLQQLKNPCCHRHRRRAFPLVRAVLPAKPRP